MSYKAGEELKDMTLNSVGASSGIDAWIRCFASNGGDYKQYRSLENSQEAQVNTSIQW